MAKIFWPGGVPDDPILESIEWEFDENGSYSSTGAGIERAAPQNVAITDHFTAAYPMTDFQWNGIFLPWWLKPASLGGCDGGVTAWFMRHPILRTPYTRQVFRFRRQQGQSIKPVRDGVDWIIQLPLQRLPSVVVYT